MTCGQAVSKTGSCCVNCTVALVLRKAGEMLPARDSFIKHKDLVLTLSVIHCRSHQRDGSSVSHGDSKADRTAKQATRLEEPERVRPLVSVPPDSRAFPSILHRNKKKLRNGAMRKQA